MNRVKASLLLYFTHCSYRSFPRLSLDDRRGVEKECSLLGSVLSASNILIKALLGDKFPNLIRALIWFWLTSFFELWKPNVEYLCIYMDCRDDTQGVDFGDLILWYEAYRCPGDVCAALCRWSVLWLGFWLHLDISVVLAIFLGHSSLHDKTWCNKQYWDALFSKHICWGWICRRNWANTRGLTNESCSILTFVQVSNELIQIIQ